MPSPRSRSASLAGELADLLDLLVGVVRVDALGREELDPGGLGLGRGTDVGAAITASMPSSMICSAVATSASTISASGTTRTTWPFTNRWPLPAPGRDAEVGFARLAGAVDHAAHHRDLERDVAILERGHARRSRP